MDSVKETIPLKPNYDISKVTTVPIKYSDTSGNEYKISMPVFRSGCTEEFLNFLTKFKDLCIKIPYNSRESIKHGLESLLQGAVLTNWKDKLRSVRNGEDSDDAMKARLDAFTRVYVTQRNALENQKDYLRDLKKNDSMTVTEFHDRLQHINLMLSSFPEADESSRFNRKDFKHLFYKGMPARWKRNYISAAQNPHNSTLVMIRECMVEQENITNEFRAKKNKKKRNSQDSSNEKPPRNNKCNKNKPKNGNHNSKYSNNSRNNNKNNQKGRLQGDDPCPLHGGDHKWDKCYQNQYGKNFRPRKNNQYQRRGSQQGNYYNHSHDHRSESGSSFSSNSGPRSPPHQIYINNGPGSSYYHQGSQNRHQQDHNSQ